MKYKELISEEMKKLAKNDKTVFIGYNIKRGSKAYGTLTDVQDKCIEMPLAENLMTSFAIGMSLEGYKPVVFFERQDFILNALDSIVNHLDKIKEMSKGEFETPIIIRAPVGGKKPLDPGMQHTQDFSEVLKKIIKFPVYELKTEEDFANYSKIIQNIKEPTLFIEYKDLYGKEIEQKEKIILDSHKLIWHTERVNAWLRGERIAPITIDCALTRRCNYRCTYCYGQLQANDEKKMTLEVIQRFLKDASEIGVKAVSFVSDGESSCSPHLYDSIIYGKKQGLDMALGTNGSLLKKEGLKEAIECLTYLRFNISAGEKERYKEIHGCSDLDYDKTIENIKECVKIKKENNLDVTIGLQMVLMSEFKDQIIPLTKLGKELGVDYLVIKHCSDDEEGSLGIDYDKYFDKDLIEKIKEAESYSDENYLVKAKWSKILSGGKRNYSRCFGPPFILQMSGSGLVAPCGMFFNDKYEKYHIGNIAEKSFKEIWESDRYWEVMDLIASEDFDAKTMCGTLCLQHKVNEYLWDLKDKGVTNIDVPEGEAPMHLNFI